MVIRTLAFACATGLFLASSADAQSPRMDDAMGGSVYDMTLNDFATQGIVRDLASVRLECLKAERVYRLDCLRQGLEQASRRTPYHGEYGPMREILRAGSAAVGPLIADNTDVSRERLEVKPGTNPRFKSRRYYTPVAAGRQDDVKAEAFKALDATQSSLLEAGKRSPAWNKAYTTVAIAVASLADILRR